MSNTADSAAQLGTNNYWLLTSILALKNLHGVYHPDWLTETFSYDVCAKSQSLGIPFDFVPKIDCYELMGKFESADELEAYLEMVVGSAAPVKSLLHFA